MENTTQLFLAVRFNCNKCHDHPFERWTQTQYYDLAAFFAQVDRKEDPRFKGQKVGGTDVEGAKPLVEIIEDGKAGVVKNVRTGAVAPPTFPFVVNDPAPPGATRREQLAHWITSKENPYFAKSYVNRLWSYLLGVGVIEPVDDIRAGNPPSNPQLLDHLTQQFIANGFNSRETIRAICKSRTYQLSIQTNPWNKGDDVNFAHAVPRRLPAEVMYDTIVRATGSEQPSAERGAGVAAARRGPGRTGRLPRPVRQAAARERLRVRALQQHDAGAGAEHGQRPRRRRGHQGSEQPDRQALRYAEGRRKGRRGVVPGRAVPSADAGRTEGGTPGAQGRRTRLRGGRRGTRQARRRAGGLREVAGRQTGAVGEPTSRRRRCGPFWMSRAPNRPAGRC